MAAGIVIRDLQKTFIRRSGEEVRAVDDVSLDVDAGRVRRPARAQRLRQDHAAALHRRASSTRTPARSRSAAGRCSTARAASTCRPSGAASSMIFQSYALWPHMTVFENVAYPLRSRAGARRTRPPSASHEVLDAGRHRRARRAAPGAAQRRPAAAGRAGARAGRRRPSCVLFDEPLSNVDAKVREQLRLELIAHAARARLRRASTSRTTRRRRWSSADRIAVLRGRAGSRRLGTPREVYEQPASRYVADFVGAANELHRHGASGATAAASWSRPRLGRLTAARGEAADGADVVRRRAARGVPVDAPDGAAQRVPAVRRDVGVPRRRAHRVRGRAPATSGCGCGTARRPSARGSRDRGQRRPGRGCRLPGAVADARAPRSPLLGRPPLLGIAVAVLISTRWWRCCRTSSSDDGELDLSAFDDAWTAPGLAGRCATPFDHRRRRRRRSRCCRLRVRVAERAHRRAAGLGHRTLLPVLPTDGPAARGSRSAGSSCSRPGPGVHQRALRGRLRLDATRAR